MEVELAVKTTGRTTGSGHHHAGDGDGATGKTKVPNYLKPSTGSCHHACKYGGAHTFHVNDAPHKQQPKARKQQPPPRVPADQHRTRTPPPRVPDQQSVRPPPPPLISRARLVPRRLFGRGGRVKVQEEAAVVVVDNEQHQQQKKAGDDGGGESGVEWKDIVAYDTPDESFPDQPDDAKSQKESPENKKPVAKPPAARPKAKPATPTKTGPKASADQPPTRHKNNNTDDTNKRGANAKPPTRGRTKNPAAVSVSAVLAKKKAEVADQAELQVGGDDAYQYQPLSSSLLQERAKLLRDLKEEMAATAPREATAATTTTDVANNKEATCYTIDPEEIAAAAAAGETGSRRPVPAHRRVKSTSVMVSSSRSVRFPFARQASNNSSSSAFKLRSKSSRGSAITTLPPPPSKEETNKPARIRSRRGSMGGDEVTGGARGVQLRIRSLRRRGLGGSGFVVPAVSLRHQKTLEKKRSQRLYNSVIEETASRLAKTRKSRVKALVGAFESVIFRIAK